MGELIELGGRLEERSALRLESPRPAFYFDLACPLSYLAAERVERLLGGVEWIPVCGAAFAPADIAAEAEERAAALRLPLVWPERFPAPVPGAMRAAAYAAGGGACARFALAAFRLAFCGGYDLDQPEVIGQLAGTAGIPREACVAAARDGLGGSPLALASSGLERRGIRRLPAIRVEDCWFHGEPALAGAAALLRDRRHAPLAHLA